MTSLLALLLAAAPAPLPFAPVEVRAGPPAGRVVEVVRGVAYLDAGARDGLAPGQEVALTRGDHPGPTCRIVSLAPRSAACAGDHVRPGDAFVVAPPPAAAPPPATPGPLAPDEAARRRAALEAVAFERFAAKPLPLRAPWRGAEARAGVASYVAGDPRHQGWFSARLRGAPVAAGVLLDLDVGGTLRVRGAEGSRFREGDRWLVDFREAALRADPSGRIALSAGRFLPWRASGARRIDGVQAGVRRGALEVGLFGGALPDPETTAPTARRVTTGAYLSHARAGTGVTARQEARLAWVSTPELDGRLELDGRSTVALGRAVDVAGSARVGVGGAARAPGLLEEARLDLAARVTPRLTLSGGVRYAGLVLPDGTDLSAPALLAGPTRRADGAVRWDARPWLSLRLSGGGASDPESGLSRAFAGPDVSMWFLSRRLGFTLGYLEERGWTSGRTLALSISGAPSRSVRLSLRGSASMRDRVDPIPAAVDAGGGLGIDADLGRGVALRGSAQVLAAASAQGAPEGRATLELVVAR